MPECTESAKKSGSAGAGNLPGTEADATSREPCHECYKPHRAERALQTKEGTLPYTAELGFLPSFGEDGGKTGEFFYIAYMALSENGKAPRPISFLFNGGPGSSSIMLHMDCLGPRRVELGDGLSISAAPYCLTDNEETLLSTSDLVFIDPVGTGYSKPEKSVDAVKAFWGCEADVRSICSFIRLYLTRNKRFRSPLYIVGESYGGFRCGSIASRLQDLGIQPAGLVLVSPALNYQDMIAVPGNDRPYVHTLPAMANSAWYHRKLPPQTQSLSKEELYRAAKEWAEGEFLLALWKGNTLSGEERRAAAEKHASFSGLKVEDILQHYLRVPLEYFAGNLLRDERKILGVYDARCAASGTAHSFAEDPSLFRAQMPAVSALLGMFTDELNFVRDEEYLFSNGKLHPDWDFSTGIPATTGGGCGFASTVGDFAKSLRRNGEVKVFVASGRYDLMCNRDSSDFSINHMDVPEIVREKIMLESYEGGHMFYTNPEARRLFRRDLEKFYRGEEA